MQATKKTNDLRNSAWKVHLHEECISTQLAMTFLSHPPATVDTLLASWAEYMASAGYEKEKARSRRVDPENAEMVQEKDRRMKLKLKVHSLRHQLRQMRSLGPGKDESKMNAKLRQKYQKWQSGDLENELHELSLQTGDAE